MYVKKIVEAFYNEGIFVDYIKQKPINNSFIRYFIFL